jgi:hypothetical protein
MFREMHLRPIATVQVERRMLTETAKWRTAEEEEEVKAKDLMMQHLL